MNKTIKVIDLLVKVANGEEVPKKIKHWKEEYERDESGFIKYESKTERNLCLDLVQCLNDEIEIIEDKEDINIQDIEHKELEIIQENLGKCDLWKGNEEYILKVINENNSRLVDAILQVSKENGVLVQAVKQLDRTKEDK